MEPKPIFLNAPEEITPAEGVDAADLGAKSLPDNPFVGLRPFKSSESMLFFGRRKQIEDLLEVLHSHRFVAVVGSSGSGKSSLIQAGLIPNLKAGFLIQSVDRWAVATMRPGEAPLRNLAAALLSAFAEKTPDEEETTPDEEEVGELVEEMRALGARAVLNRLRDRMLASGGDAPSVNLLLLVDQFEEIFRFGSFGDEDEGEDADSEVREGRWGEATDFVSIMLELSSQAALPVYVVTTMRSDFLSDCDAFYGLPEAMNRSQYLVPRLTRAQRQEAIENPVLLYNEEMSARLVDRVLNDMGDEPDQLPVMQHALMRTWEKWAEGSGGPVDLEHYEHEEVGTIKAALALDAERAVNGKPPEPEMTTRQKIITKRMFQALTQTDAKGRRLRRPARVGDIAAVTESSPDEVISVVRRFIDDNRSFLILYDAPKNAERLVDISHESLIRKWQKLRKWVDAEARSRDHYLRIAGEAERYGRGETALLSGTALQVALRWWKERQPSEPWARRYHKKISPPEKFIEKSKDDFKRTDDFLRESERVRTEDVAKKEAARQLELKQAKQLARQRKTTAMILAVVTVLFACLFLFAVYARQQAVRSLNQAQRSELKALDAQKELQVEKDKLNEANLKLEVKTRELEGNQLDLQGANETLEEEKRKQLQANAQLTKTVKDLKDEQARGRILRTRGEGYTAYANALDAEQRADHSEVDEEKLSNLRQAHGSYIDATTKFGELPELDDKVAGAGVQAKLGKLMFRNEFKLENAGDQTHSGAAGEPDARPSPMAATSVEKVVNVVLASATPSPEVFGPLGIGREEMEALTHYGAAITSYRKHSDERPSLSAGSAALLEELGEYFDPSGEERSGFKEVPSDDPKNDAERVRRQAAVILFCAARGDMEKARKPAEEATASARKQISLLLKIGYRLMPSQTATATSSSDGGERAPAGCEGIPPDPKAFFKAALNLYHGLIEKDAGNPEAAKRWRAEGADVAVLLGKVYLRRDDKDVAEDYFNSSVSFYSPDNPLHREALVTLLTTVAKIYLNEDSTINIEPNIESADRYMEVAYQIVKKSDSRTQSPATDQVAEVVTEMGRISLELKDAEVAASAFEAATELYDAKVPEQRDKLSELLIKIGGFYFDYKMMEQAKKSLEDTVALYGEPTNPEQRQAISDALFKVATVFQEHEQEDVALGYYNRAADVFVKEKDSLKAAETYEKIGDQLPSEKGSDVRYYVQAADEYGKARLLAANEEDKAELTDKQVDNLKKTARSLRALVKSGELTDEFRRVLLKSYEDILALYHDMSSADYKAKTLKYVAEGYVELRMPDTAVKTYQEALPLLASSALRAKGDIFFGIGKAEESKGPAGIQAAEAAYMKAKEFYVPAGADMSAQQAEDALKNLRETGTTPTPTPTPIPTPTPDDRRSGQGAGDTLKARLNGAFEGGGGPKGRAKFQVDEDEGVIEREFEVRVEQVDLPANTVLDVYVDGLRVGAITLRGDGKRSTLTLKSSDGVSVPQVNPYSRVVVTDSAGKVVVAGSFGEPPRISPQTR